MGYWNPKGDEEAMVNIFKVGISDIHRETDKIFIDQFLRGRISQQTYALFISQLYYVYEAMEEELCRHRDHPIVGPVYFPTELTRLPSIEKDLEYLYGTPNWREKIPMLNTTQEYVARIREVGNEAPALLMSHMFTRYMGDLFGGQILKRKWRKVFEFPDEKGVLFYTFDHVDSVHKLREFIEVRVNSLEMSLKEKHQQLEEMKLVFKYNTDLVLEILQVAKTTPGGFLEPVEKEQSWEEEIKELGMGETGGCMFAPQKNGKKATCPVSHDKKEDTCPVSHEKKEGACPMSRFQKSSLPKYGLLLCATLAVAYPIARKVFR